MRHAIFQFCVLPVILTLAGCQSREDAVAEALIDRLGSRGHAKVRRVTGARSSVTPDWSARRIRGREHIADVSGGTLWADRIEHSEAGVRGKASGRVFWERGNSVAHGEPRGVMPEFAYSDAASFDLRVGTIRFEGFPSAESRHMQMMATSPATVISLGPVLNLTITGPTRTFLNRRS